MKTYVLRFFALSLLLIFTSSFNASKENEFQGKAYYFSKSTMELGSWGSRLSEAQKKEIANRLKNRLEKTYVLNFNKEESIFQEEDKLDAVSGATDSWGKNFTPGESFKNIKQNAQVQSQEFYGKKFLVKDKLQEINWQFGKETKQIGDYTCFKATASINTAHLNWYNFSWSQLSNTNKDADNENENVTLVEAWYTPQIPVSHGPLDYWGLPGLILEVSAGTTTMLCSKIVINPEEKIEIQAPNKGKVVTKKEYQETISSKMKEFRDNRMRRRG